MAQNNSEALADLAASLGLELSFDGDSVCELLIDDDAVVALTGDPEGSDLRITAIIGDLEDADDAAALRLLLQANYNGQGVGDAALGMDHVSQEIVLTQTVTVGGVGDQGLNGTLEKFVHYLTFWKHNLSRLAAANQFDDLSDAVPGAVRV